MNKNEAKEKIIKILRLANDHAATEGEKKNALELANTLAAKYGLKIVTGNQAVTPSSRPSASVEVIRNVSSSWSNQAILKILLASMVKAHVLKRVYSTNGKITGFDHISGISADEFNAFYKKMNTTFEAFKKTKKENLGNAWDRELANLFRKDFERGYFYGFNGHIDLSRFYPEFSSLGKEFRNML